MNTEKSLFITDFDGTLLRSDRTLAQEDLQTLNHLGSLGIVRVIATGRSLYSFNRAVTNQLPIDYIIFSTGAGVIKYPEGELLRKIDLKPDAVQHAIQTLMAAELDFMVHRPVPDNHEFAYWGSQHGETDFSRRIELYKECSWPLDGNSNGFGAAAQLLAVVTKSRSMELLESLKNKLPALNIIRTTSPLDGESTWIEFFPPDVSKSRAAHWLATQLAIRIENTISVGNDYNDLDLLEWSHKRFVVDNAPQDLKDRFPTVRSNNNCGISEAVKLWLDRKGG